jgi:recombinational DNA repair protein (RecF pathway)
MPVFSSPAILLRRMDYGDFDVIITFFTLKRGKLSLIAKGGTWNSSRVKHNTIDRDHLGHFNREPLAQT